MIVKIYGPLPLLAGGGPKFRRMNVILIDYETHPAAENSSQPESESSQQKAAGCRQRKTKQKLRKSPGCV